MRAQLSPLPPLPDFIDAGRTLRAAGSGRKVRPPSFRSDVAALQVWLNTEGAGLEEDGKLGPATDAALARYGLPPATEVPQLCAWVGRAWASEPKAMAEKAQELGLSRVSMFLNPLDGTGIFSCFGSEARMVAALDAFASAGVGVDFTAWIWPRPSYVSGMQAAISDVLDEYRGVRLCLDCEGPWGRPAPARERAAVVSALTDWLPAERLMVTDYASIQEPTVTLCLPGVTVVPQVYSVAETRNGVTDPSSIYWPGRTQPYGMHPRRWGGMLETCPLEMGLASYKPFPASPGGFSGSPGEWQVLTQVRAAMWYRPRRLWFWELTRMAPAHESTIRRLTGNVANPGVVA